MGAKYISTTKPECLPNEEIEDSNNPHTVQEKKEIKKHLVALYRMTYAFQNNLALMNYINQSKSDDWPNGRLWIVFTNIERFFKMTLCDVDPYKTKVGRDKAMDEVLWHEETDDNGMCIK